MNRVRLMLTSLAALGALALPATAHASYQQVIRDCAQDGQLDRNYSNQELEQARKNLPADLDEYSDCREVISAAITSAGSGGSGGDDSGGGSGGSGGGGAGGGGAADREADAAALDKLTKSGDPPRLDIGGRPVEPGSNGLFDLASASNGVPLALILALAAVGLLTMGGGAYALRRRFPALANVSLPSLKLPRVRLPFLNR